MFRHILPCPPLIVSAAVQRSAEKPRQESRRGLIGRPEGRPRPERVLKDAGAPPSFRTNPAAEAGLQPVRSPVATPQRPFSAATSPLVSGTRRADRGARPDPHANSGSRA